MNTGIEIALQAVLRLERDFIVVRGRTTGSTDTGRVLIIPFDQINYLAFNRSMTEPEVQALLGPPGSLSTGAEAPPPASGESAPVPLDMEAVNAQLAAVSAEARQATQSAADTSTAPPETEAPATAATPTAPKPAPVSKSILLARLRARLKENSGKSTR
jgi:hypothetical protein